MFKYQKGLTEFDGIMVILITIIIIAVWFAIGVSVTHTELNEALNNSGITCKPMKVNGKWYCAERITIIKSNDSTEQYSAKEIDK